MRARRGLTVARRLDDVWVKRGRRGARRLVRCGVLVAPFVELLNRMKPNALQFVMRTAALVMAFCLLAGSASVDAAAPDPGEIVEQAVRRAAKLAAAPAKAVHLYDKRTTIETIDSQGKVTKTKVKLFEVTLRGGVPDARLVGIEGRQLSSRQLREEDEKMRRRRRIFLGQDETSGSAKRGTFVPEDLTQRFAVSYIGVETIGGRATHVVSFAPRSPAPRAATLADKVANEMRGRLWIDVAEHEIARIDVDLRKKVKLWGGILGALDDFSYSLKRRRSGGGVWHNSEADIFLNARGLLKRLRFHVVEKSGNFRKAPGLADAPDGG